MYGSAVFDQIHYKPNRILYSERSQSLGLYIVTKGYFKLVKTGNDGKDQIIKIASEGDLLGYTEIISDTTHTTSAVAIADAIVNFIPKEDFLRLYNENSDLRNNITRQLCRDVQLAESKIVSIAYMPVRGRLAEALLEVAEDSTVVHIKREDLANLIGTAKETVIRLLSELKKSNIIAIKGREINVLNSNALNRISMQYH